jgi:hypothetical protein
VNGLNAVNYGGDLPSRWEEVAMFIRDFHSKLVSGKEEGKLFEALRRLKGIESLKALSVAATDGAWSVWTEDGPPPLAMTKA